ncbi:hypothetical protein [Glutamicibacter sp. TV12E]|uniref:hypothetical protein n=1 Tax=Glutamicibacter sp. TV12E TaxID=3446362 RepID=UPI00403488B5
MATAKGSTAGRAKSANTAPVASTEVKDTGGVEADLLKFVDPEAAKAAEASKAAEKEPADAVPAGPESEPEVPAVAGAEGQDGGNAAPEAEAEAEASAEAPEADATSTVGPAGRDYLVLATALAAPDGTLHSRGQVIELTADKAEWLLDRGMVKPA